MSLTNTFSTKQLLNFATRKPYTIIMENQMSNPLEFARENQDRYLKELMDFLRIPSVSTQPEHKNDVASAAAWLASCLTRLAKAKRLLLV